MTSKTDVDRELDLMTDDERAELRELYSGRSIDERVAKKQAEKAQIQARAVYGIIHNPKFNRRRFLQAAGASAVLAPFLGMRALSAGRALAQMPPRPSLTTCC